MPELPQIYGERNEAYVIRKTGAPGGGQGLRGRRKQAEQGRDRGLSGSALKYIAAFSMLLDHVGLVLLEYLLVYGGHILAFDSPYRPMVVLWAGGCGWRAGWPSLFSACCWRRGLCTPEAGDAICFAWGYSP